MKHEGWEILRLIREEVRKGAQQKGYTNSPLLQASFGKQPVEAFRVDKSLELLEKIKGQRRCSEGGMK